MISHVLNILATAAALIFATISAHASKEAPTIGFSIDGLRVERWTYDRDYFIESVRKLGATTNVQSVNANEVKQIVQIEDLIAQNVDMPTIAPFNSEVLDNATISAKKKGIKVVSYDRLILNAGIDGYVTLGSVKMGKLQAQGVVKLMPKDSYFLLDSAMTDDNARPLREGQMKVFKSHADKGDIKIVDEQWMPEWDPSKAQSIVENVLTANDNNTRDIVVSSDGTAGDMIQVLACQKSTGKVLVSGQGADLAAVERVAEGTQTITVYKPVKQIAAIAAEVAVDLVRGVAPKFNAKLNNGKKDVDTVLLIPTLLTKDNLDSTVAKGSLYIYQQIFGK